MNTVEGLDKIYKSAQADTNRKNKRIAYKPKKQKNKPEPLTPTEAIVDSFESAGQPDTGQAQQQLDLAQALQGFVPLLQRYQKASQDAEKKKLAYNLDSIVYNLVKDNKDGNISDVQLKKEAPWTTATTRDTVKHAVAHEAGQKFAQEQAIELGKNAELLSDPQAMKIAKDKALEGGLASMDRDDVVAMSGFIKGSNSVFNPQMNKWIAGADTIQRQASAKEYSDNITNILSANDPDNIAKSIEHLNLVSDVSSPNSKSLREDLALKSIKEYSQTTGDTTVLDKLPKELLTERNKVYFKAIKKEVDTNEFNERQRNRQVNKQNEQDLLADNKAALLTEFNAGTLKTDDIINVPELYNYRKQLLRDEENTSPQSLITYRNIENAFLDGATNGSTSMLLQNLGINISEDKIDLKTAREAVLNASGLKAGDRTKLLDKLPNIMQGRNLIQDNSFNDTYGRLVSPELSTILHSARGSNLPNLGLSVQSIAYETYTAHVTGAINAFLSDPLNRDKVIPINQIYKDASKESIERAKSLAGFRVSNNNSTNQNKDNDSNATKGIKQTPITREQSESDLYEYSTPELESRALEIDEVTDRLENWSHNISSLTPEEYHELSSEQTRINVAKMLLIISKESVAEGDDSSVPSLSEALARVRQEDKKSGSFLPPKLYEDIKDNKINPEFNSEQKEINSRVTDLEKGMKKRIDSLFYYQRNELGRRKGRKLTSSDSARSKASRRRKQQQQKQGK